MKTHTALAPSPQDDEALINTLREHVAMDTSAGHDAHTAKSNVPYIQHVKTQLEKAMHRYGVPQGLYECVVRESEYPTGVRQQTLGFRLGAKAHGGVAFAGHSDVVPIGNAEEIATWKDGYPFDMQDKMVDGQRVLIGRGVADMKAGNVTAIESILQSAQAGAGSLEKPVYLVLTHNEELGCKGVDDAKQVMRDLSAEPELIVVPEPTGGAIVNGHKGVRAFEFDIKGNAAISGADYALLLANKLKAVQETMINTKTLHDSALNPPYPVVNMGIISQQEDGSVKLGIFARTTPNCEAVQVEQMVLNAQQEVETEISHLHALPHIAKNAPQEAHNITLSGLSAHSAFPELGINTIDYMASVADAVRTTRTQHGDVAIHLADIQSGKAANEIPPEAMMRVVIQGDDNARAAAWNTLQENIRTIHKQMQQKSATIAAENPSADRHKLAQAGIVHSPTPEISLPAQSMEAGIICHDMANAAALSTHDVSRVVEMAKNAWGVTDVPVETRPFGTDAGGLQKAFPNAVTVVFGPGDITKGCHGVGERLENPVEELRKFVAFNNEAITTQCRALTHTQEKPGTVVIADGKAPELGINPRGRHV